MPPGEAWATLASWALEERGRSGVSIPRHSEDHHPQARPGGLSERSPLGLSLCICWPGKPRPPFRAPPEAALLSLCPHSRWHAWR